jgi:hypothetical protein
MFPPVTMAEGGSCAGMINENSASGAMMATVRVGFMELSGKNDTPHFGPGKADGQLERKNTRGSGCIVNNTGSRRADAGALTYGGRRSK